MSNRCFEGGGSEQMMEEAEDKHAHRRQTQAYAPGGRSSFGDCQARDRDLHGLPDKERPGDFDVTTPTLPAQSCRFAILLSLDVPAKSSGNLQSTPLDVRPQTKIRQHTPREDKSSICQGEEHPTADTYTSKRSATTQGRYPHPHLWMTEPHVRGALQVSSQPISGLQPHFLTDYRQRALA